MGSGGQMSVAQYLTFVAPFVVTILVVFGMKYFSALFQARAKLAHDAQYRTLTERAVSAQSDSQAALVAIRTDLAKLATSLASVEKILQQVE
jgi:hypothetical protein